MANKNRRNGEIMFNNLIIQAIREKCKIEFTYKNKKRIADPHVFGVNTKSNEVILCWQTGGSSSKPKDLPNWRMFKTSKIQDLQITNDKFIPQLQHHELFMSDIRQTYATV